MSEELNEEQSETTNESTEEPRPEIVGDSVSYRCKDRGRRYVWTLRYGLGPEGEQILERYSGDSLSRTAVGDEDIRRMLMEELPTSEWPSFRTAIVKSSMAGKGLCALMEPLCQALSGGRS